MSSSHHEDHYLQEQKPIAFTVPFILASVLILVIFLLVSVCDPKPHHNHEAGHHGQMAPAMSAGHNEGEMEKHEAAMENHEEATAAGAEMKQEEPSGSSEKHTN